MAFLSADGFLGTRASVSLDMVFVAMGVIAPTLLWSVVEARRGNYLRHKRIQLCLAGALAVALAAFELDMRFGGGWRERAVASPYFQPPASASPAWDFVCRGLLQLERTPGLVDRLLAIHLFFATTTTVLWVGTVADALRRFPNPPTPVRGNRHRRLGWAATLDMLATAATGWAFYWCAFAAQ